MRKFTMSLFVMCTLAGNAAEVVRVRPFEFHSSFWMSLHQTLIADAMSTTPRDLSPLSAEEQTAWNAAVAAYRAAGGRGDMTFADPMAHTSDALTQIADDAAVLMTDAPLTDALKGAAPVYRRHWWAADDETNRFFIAYAAAMVREAGEVLIRQHETVYRTPWPARIRVYVTPYGGPFGAYTMSGRAGGTIVTMSSRDAGYQGLRALEMLLHESSHSVVGPRRGTVATAIEEGAKRHGIAIPRDLWHALLFATSSELTRRYLAAHGAPDFVPSSVDLFTRVWPRYKAPVEKHWLPYLDGKGTLEEAVEKIVGDIPR